MADEHPQIYTDVSPQGSWNTDLTTMLTPGPHTLIVTDEHGNQDQSLIFVQETIQPTIVEVVKPSASVVHEVQKVVEVVPSSFLYTGLFLALLFLGFTTASYVFGFKIRKTEKNQPTGVGAPHRNVQKLSKALMAVSVVVSGVLLGYIIYLVVSNKPIYHAYLQLRKPEVILGTQTAVAGAVIDPLTLLTVADVSLTVGEVTITTGVSGQFTFQDVVVDNGIHLHHAELEKTFVILPDRSERQDVFFNPALYKQVEKIVSAESRGDLTALYNTLEVTSRTALKPEELPRYFTGAFTQEDVGLTEIRVRSVERVGRIASEKRGKVYRDVVRVTLENNDQTEVYEFVYDGQSWGLMK